MFKNIDTLSLKLTVPLAIFLLHSSQITMINIRIRKRIY